jgi:hypothetical protein
MFTLTDMKIEDQELEKLVLSFVTFAVQRMEVRSILRIEALREYKKIVPKYFELIKTQSLQDHIDLLSAHRKDPYFGVYVEKILSPAGLKWLEQNYPVLKRAAEESGE